MAQISTTSVADILRISYSTEEYIAPHERFMCRSYDLMMEFERGDDPVGASHKFEIVTRNSHSGASVAEGSDWPTFRVPASVQATVTARQFLTPLAFTDMMLEVAKAGGMIHAIPIVDRYASGAVQDHHAMMNRNVIGHGTGRMAVVQDATVTSTTAIMRNPEGTWQLREGMYVGAYDTDAGAGTLQGAVMRIVAIDDDTRTVTWAAAVTLTAGWGIYRMASDTVGDYALGTNGIRGIVDNGTLTTTIFGLTRADYPGLNAQIVSPSTSGSQSYSEALVRQCVNRVRRKNGMEPSHVLMNQGMVSEHCNFLTPSRMYTVTGKGVPAYQIGQNEDDLGVMQNGKKIPFIVDTDYPAAEMAFLTLNLFRRHTLKQAEWVGDYGEGGGSPKLLRAPGTGQNFNTSVVGALQGFINVASLMPGANCRATSVADAENNFPSA